MRPTVPAAVAALAATLLAACATGTDRAPPAVAASTPLPPAEATAWRDRGARTVQPFKQRLMGALQAALPAGADRAIETCRVEAPALAAASGGPGVTVGRTSHRLRNPANAPRPWVAPLLGEFVADPGVAAPRAVALPTGGIGYVEPIVTQPLCLACHGEALAPAVRARLAAQYPADAATGFRTGDFRGVFWVEFAPEALAPP
jgi:hypothetical protein